jgi:hypothetical protein
MKMRFISDIHNECRKHQTRLHEPGEPRYSRPWFYDIEELPDDKDTVLLLGGDIDSSGADLELYVMDLVRRFRFVFYVPGNHEYYNESIDEFDTLMRMMNRDMPDCFRAFVPGYQDPVVFDDVMFCGATLWTDLRQGDAAAIDQAKRGMMDYRQIAVSGETLRYIQMVNMYNEEEARRLFKERVMWTPELAMEAHKRDLRSIKDALDDTTTTKKVVLTHHMPKLMDFDFGHPCDPNRNMTYSFNCTDIDDETIAKADYWFCGHGHNVGEVRVGDCKIITNALGYGKYEGLPTNNTVWEI